MTPRALIERIKKRFLRTRRRTLLILAVTVGGFLILLLAADRLLDEPLRRYMEARINRVLTGYTVRISALDFHLFGGSLDLEKVVITQDAHPDPPIALVPRLSASVQWKALLSARLVADFIFDKPEVHIDLAQLGEENGDSIPVSRKGWQEALEAVYPLKINELRVVDGSLVYTDEGDYRPLRATHVEFVARNIRNIRSKDREYPSDIDLRGVVFESGTLRLEGHADFLAKPHPGLKAVLALDRMDVTYFQPIAHRYNLVIHNGVVTTQGDLEYAARIQSLNLETVTIDGASVDYVHTSATDAQERQTASKIAQAARDVSEAPGLVLRIGSLRLRDGRVAYIDKTTKPGYHVYVSNADLEIKNLSNQSQLGSSEATLEGLFMGSGGLHADAVLRANPKGQDFDLSLKINDTKMTGMNDLLRSYGKFDVVAGFFSFFAEVKVRDGQMTGYVKPLFRDLNVYDPVQDRKKSLFHKMYEGLVGGVAKILENRKRKEVATVTSISGPLANAKTSTLEIIGGLIRNAFFKAILPGFDREIPRRTARAMNRLAQQRPVSSRDVEKK